MGVDDTLDVIPQTILYCTRPSGAARRWGRSSEAVSSSGLLCFRKRSSHIILTVIFLSGAVLPEPEHQTLPLVTEEMEGSSSVSGAVVRRKIWRESPGSSSSSSASSVARSPMPMEGTHARWGTTRREPLVLRFRRNSLPHPGVTSVAGRARSSGFVPGFPPFDAVLPLYWNGGVRPCVTARSADRAVLVDLRRFLAANHVTLDSTYKQELPSVYRSEQPGVQYGVIGRDSGIQFRVHSCVMKC